MDTTGQAGERSGNRCRVRLQNAHTDSITGTSTGTPTTVAGAATLPAPYRAIAVATAGSGLTISKVSGWTIGRLGMEKHVEEWAYASPAGGDEPEGSSSARS